MSSPNHILPNTPLSPAEDYALLRAEGLRILQSLSGQQWTDFQVHDPGITILEQLCFALADLGYRLGHPMPDLLTGPDGTFAIPEDFRARSILTTQPVTLDDYRRMLLDLEGVRNAWVEIDPEGQPLISMRWDGKMHIFQPPDPPEEKEEPTAEEEQPSDQAPADSEIDEMNTSEEVVLDPLETANIPIDMDGVAEIVPAEEEISEEEPGPDSKEETEIPISPELLAMRALFVDSFVEMKGVFKRIYEEGTQAEDPKEKVDALLTQLRELLALYTLLYQRKALRDHLFSYLGETASPPTYHQLVAEVFVFLERQFADYEESEESEVPEEEAPESLFSLHHKVVDKMQSFFRQYFIQFAPDSEELRENAVLFLLNDLQTYWSFYDLEDSQWPMRKHLRDQLRDTPTLTYSQLVDAAFQQLSSYQEGLKLW